MGVLPLAALFILFDFVVHNPTHSETRNNLSLLDVAAGHFSLLDYKSGGFLPASLITEFAQIARQYVQDYAARQPLQHQPIDDLGLALPVPTSVDTEVCSRLVSTNNTSVLSDHEQSPTQSSWASSNTSNNNAEVADNIVESWELRDHLYYPTTPELNVPGMIENTAIGSFNIQSLFGFVVPEFGYDQ